MASPLRQLNAGRSPTVKEIAPAHGWSLALRDGQSCHVHYVAGSYPDANAQARRAADDLARDFNCDSDVPTSDSNIGPPPIAMIACRELQGE